MTSGDEELHEKTRPCKDCALSASDRISDPQSRKRGAPSGPSGEGGDPPRPTPPDKGKAPARDGSKKQRQSARDTTTDATPTPELPASPTRDGNNLMLVCR